MQQYQIQFLDYVTSQDILRFGDYTLKSGRKSPYFFNAGLFCTGQSLGFVARSYAEAIVDSGIDFDVIFGPAYKGISLASATAISLSENHGINKPYCFNRKETKDHGEGGSIVGAPLKGKVLIIDDVITAGTAIREVMNIIREAGAEAVGVVVALDRQEKGSGELSAIQEIEADYGVPVFSIINLDQIVDYLQSQQETSLRDYLPALETYRTKYGIA